MTKTLVAAAAALALAAPAAAQEKHEVKVAAFVGAQHFMSKWLVQWGEKLEKASGGRLVFKHFPGASMAPVPGHYDLAASGRAEVSWFLHGSTPGRFPLTELTHLPYVVGSAEIGTKTINDAQLRAKYLDAEHRGVKVDRCQSCAGVYLDRGELDLLASTAEASGFFVSIRSLFG